MTEPQLAGATPPVLAPNLEAQLTCSICTDLLHQPLTLLDCLHTFCGACLKEWFSFQAQRIESSPGPPPPPGTPLFTCPSCRAGVRDTKHDARVFSLLDMFLALNPGRGKSEEEKREMDARYRKGGRVMPRVRKVEERTEEERWADEEERRVLEQVRLVSLREATEGVGSSGSSGPSASAGRRGNGNGGRNRSRDASRVRGSGSGSDRERDGGAATGSGRRRAQSVTVRAGDGSGGERESGGGRRRSESRQRGSQGAVATALEADVRARQVEHQSSLRNLISTDGMDIRDIEREVEEFARQIQEEGLLDGLDLDNLDLENNDELSRKITEAYRRRHRERRRDGGRRSNASAHSHRSDIAAARPRSRTDDNSRPTSRHAARSRAPSVGSDGDRSRYPPSSSAHLDVGEQARRRRASSGARSATLPTVPTAGAQASSAGSVGSRAQTDLSGRARGGSGADSHVRRPSMGLDARSSSSPTTAGAAGPVSRRGSPANQGMPLPFSARAIANLGLQAQTQQAQGQAQQHTQPQTSDGRSTSAHSGRRSDRPGAIDVRPESPTLGSSSTPPNLVSPPLSPRRPDPQQQTARYKEPYISCNVCHREHIEYDLHYNCSLCHSGEWNICLDCWRRRKGCLHWFGFGAAAWARWEKINNANNNNALGDHNQQQPPAAPPHVLAPRRYLPPKQIPAGADTRRMLMTPENPADRLQTGTFCARCEAWTNECYWRCDTCNDGEWGFCSGCVSQGNACTHPLLALEYHESGGPPSPTTTTMTTPHTNNFQPVLPTPCCSACRIPIAPSDPHHHCYTCLSNNLVHQVPDHAYDGPSTPPHDKHIQQQQQQQQNSYDLCTPCYTSFLTDGTIAPENGPSGWRRCLRGHRMVVVVYAADPEALRAAAAAAASPSGGPGSGYGPGAGSGYFARYLRRRVIRDLVGGRRLRFQEVDVPRTDEGRVWIASWGDDQGEGGNGNGNGNGNERKKWERLYAEDVGIPTASLAPTLGLHINSHNNGNGNSHDNSTGEGRFTKSFPPDGGTGLKAVAGWGWTPAAGVQDELLFPRGAEVLEVEDVNGEWFHGFYMGTRGLFPAPYVRL
ncbi:hypothetical protein B0J18DRAFT_177355 [Chaetomium sp. MPI-SDFR-AT-0129]|nr:hypothetical protein B0J18DRAFT_177355 [Chaetomium sp. MPI-SDFR-AT-0129]